MVAEGRRAERGRMARRNARPRTHASHDMIIRLRAGMTITQHTMDSAAISDGVHESLIHSSFH
jgi:hypothetical protein